MSLVDIDSWPTEYEACERLNHSIKTSLTQRANRQRLSPEHNRLTATIQIQTQQFETELEQLKIKLGQAAKNRSITSDEADRRQRQLDLLQSQLLQLRENFTNTSRDQKPSNSNSLWQATSATELGNNRNDPTNSLKKVDVETAKREQIDILEEQNRGLETLSQTISRQRALASQLGNEVDDQNEILDNLANTMERVDTRVNVETGNIGQISRQDSTWCYWMVIIILLVAIVIFAFI